MVRRSIVTAVAALTLFLAGVTGAGAIALNIDGTWSFVLDSTSLKQANTPGATFKAQTSTAGTINLDVSGAVGNWRMDVRRVDTDWDPNNTVEIRRTGNGTGSGSKPSGGGTWMVLTTTDQQFFTGNLDRTDIQIRFRVTPNIAYVSAKLHTATIWLTVTDT